MSALPRVVVAGHICLDIIPDLADMRIAPPDFYRPGKLAEAGPAALSTGGPVSNTGLALHILGVPVSLMGKVGDDPFGALLRGLLAERAAALTAGMAVVPGESTSYSVCLSPAGLDRMFVHCPGANDTFAAADLRDDVLSPASLFHFGYPPLMRCMYEDDGRELAEIFRRVKGLGLTTSLDLSLPDPARPAGRVDWRRILAATLPYVDICLPSAEETLFMLDRPRYDAYRGEASDILPLFTGADFTRLADELLGFGAKIVGLKCGERGFYLRTAGAARLADMGRARPAGVAGWAGRELWEPSFRAPQCVSATGSGDSSIAGFYAAYLRGWDAVATLRFACAVGACNVTAADAISGIRSWDETNALIQAGWAKNPLTVISPGWSVGLDGMWRGPNDRAPRIETTPSEANHA